MIGQLVGHYRILEKIGAGGMGEVFRARDERLGRDVALKLIRPASSDNPDHLRRFEQEARAAAALNHPNILAIFDVGLDGSAPYIVSELLEGKTLHRRLQEGSLPVPEASNYALQIAQGLIAAHDRKIVHRDLKPENLFLTVDGRLKILDFGVAKLQAPLDENRSIESLTTVTRSGALVGTYAYMSPEQLRGKSVDHRSDIFSFGAILYEMVTGIRAFRGETQVDTMTAVLKEQPSDSELEQAAIPTTHREIIKHCLEKDPDQRFQSAKDLAFALQTLTDGHPVRRSSSSRQGPRASYWALIAVLAVAAIILAANSLLRPRTHAPTYQRLTYESGTVYAARFTRDGQAIVYSAAWNGKPVQLFSTVGNSLLSQPLNLSDANLLAVGPNHDLAVVRHGTHNGQLETVDGTLALVPLAGGSPRDVLSDVRWADWNAKGELAVVHYVDGHCRLEFPIDKVLYQSAGWISDIRFSPGGDQIAFMNHPAVWDDRGTVSVVDLAGHVRTLTHEWESESGLAWRPDGQEIWFSAATKGNDSAVLAVTLTGELRTVLDLPVGVILKDIAADGRALVSIDSKRLALGFASSGKPDVDLSWHDWDPARDISSDGRFVLFEDASQVAGSHYAVVLRNVDGTLPIQLGEGSPGAISPDGRWVLASSTGNDPKIILLPIGTGQSRTLHVTGLTHIQNGWARYLPDGQHALVNGDRTGEASRCYLVDLSNGDSRAITDPGFLCGPISPDGASVLGRRGNQARTIYSLQGQAPRPLLNLSEHFVPVQWSRDGLYLLGYHSGEFPSRIYKAAISTGKETFLQELKPGAPAGVVMVGPVVISRDGKSVAYSYNQTMSTLHVVSGLR